MNYRNQRVLAEARCHPCQLCRNDDSTTVAAHSNQGRHGKGMGIKAHDIVAYLCYSCHTFVDQGNTSADIRNKAWHTALVRSVPLYRHLLDQQGMELADDMVRQEI